MCNFNEKQILIQIKQNNLENFDYIYKKYYKKVFFLALKMLSDEKLAEDITQEVFIDTIHGIKNLKNLDIFEAWISKITINKVNTKRKKIKTVKENQLNYDNELLNNIVCDESSLEDRLIKSEFQKEFLDIINELPEKKRRMILLYYYENFSLSEISLIENIPIGTVKSRLYSTKKILKDSLRLKKLINFKASFLIVLVLIFNSFNINYFTYINKLSFKQTSNLFDY
ncbi:RNA polymerase sigma factor [Clostridium perfringens]|uniref:RNA polymerase sigma factor n=2 Tax=Clostridium perfringens TaxID=1502 RepID=UPI0022469D22|nr:RNA polymerase sigma factor [Clostridium perfringens]MCX0375037.1 RNA polymerase sigma factor [Clostridium perfringens]MCX0402101.1 RNA polymerase sigma factor [Clostridium perfringens]MDU1308756.1 RNA polymerase sigma factor [Clostridium perfringens]